MNENRLNEFQILFWPALIWIQTCDMMMHSGFHPPDCTCSNRESRSRPDPLQDAEVTWSCPNFILTCCYIKFRMSLYLIHWLEQPRIAYACGASGDWWNTEVRSSVQTYWHNARVLVSSEVEILIRNVYKTKQKMMFAVGIKSRLTWRDVTWISVISVQLLQKKKKEKNTAPDLIKI